MSQPSSHLTSVGDLYSAYMLNKRAEHYGAKAKPQFKKEFHKIIQDKWLGEFDSNDFTFKFQENEEGRKTGVTIESIQFLETITSQAKELGEAAQKKAGEAISNLLKHTSSFSEDSDSENQIFFFAPKNAANPQEFDLSQLNSHMLNILIEGSALPGVKVTLAQLNGFKNYFIGRAVSQSSVQSLYYALKGLKSQKQNVFLQAVPGFEFVMGDGSQKTLKYKVVDSFGNAAKAESVSKATLKMIKGTEQPIDVTTMAKVNGGEVSIELSNINDLAWAAYSLNMDLVAGGKTVNVKKSFSIKL